MCPIAGRVEVDRSDRRFAWSVEVWFVKRRRKKGKGKGKGRGRGNCPEKGCRYLRRPRLP
jgi:hypothetical protein